MSHLLSKRLCVAALSWETSESSLRAAFERFGPLLEATVERDRASGRPTGLAFVTFADRGAAVQAIAQMSGAVLDGSTIRVGEPEIAAQES